MSVILVLSVSVLLQLAAVVMSLRLMRTFGGRLVWLTLAAAILLMSIRRIISLGKAINEYPAPTNSLDAELVALVISALILVAISSMRPMIEAIKRSQKKLTEQTRRNQIILQSNPDGFLITDLDGYIQEVNKSFAEIGGYQQDELLLRRLDKLINLKVAGKNNLLKQLPILKVVRFESVLKNKDEKQVYIAVTAKCVEFKEQKFIYVFVRDISESKKAQKALSEEKQRAQVTLESIGDGVITTNIFGYVQYLNPVAEGLIGISEKHIVGKLLVNHLMLFDEHQPDKVINPISDCLENNKSYVLSDQKLFSANANNNYSVDVVVSPLHNDKGGDVIGAVLIIHNTTELKSLAETLSYQATHDALTGLINRREFENRMEAALNSAKIFNLQHAMCYLDLDQFKLVNDTCGHIAGDELLKQLTQLLHNAIRETDTLARLGGDEFGVLLESCSMEQAKRAVDAIFQEIGEYRFQWEGRVFDIGLSIGLVPITSGSGSLTDVLSSADSACYIAKENGRNCMHMYVPNDAAIEQRRGQMEWVQRLQQALDHNFFELFCQSIKPVNGNSGFPHVEVLLRMKGENGELISPSEFLPAAERYHMMPGIDRWVLKEVFQNFAHHKCNRNETIDMVAVNLSGQSMGDEEFLDYVLELFHRYKVPGRHICFEVTETSVISNITFARNFISVMKNFGCRFALDDFGSGLSSFQYLKDLDVDYIKIDGSFIRSMLYNDNSYNMVTSINHIGHVMGLKTIAEFVENNDISTLLEDIGVDYIQGYFVDEPHPIGGVAVGAS